MQYVAGSVIRLDTDHPPSQEQSSDGTKLMSELVLENHRLKEEIQRIRDSLTVISGYVDVSDSLVDESYGNDMIQQAIINKVSHVLASHIFDTSAEYARIQRIDKMDLFGCRYRATIYLVDGSTLPE